MKPSLPTTWLEELLFIGLVALIACLGGVLVIALATGGLR